MPFRLWLLPLLLYVGLALSRARTIAILLVIFFVFLLTLFNFLGPCSWSVCSVQSLRSNIPLFQFFVIVIFFFFLVFLGA